MQGKWRQGPVVALAALILGVLIAQIAVAGGSDDGKIASLQRQVNQLRAEVGAQPAGPALTSKKKKKKKTKPGPAGPQGPPGPQGLAGPAGSPAGGMLFGWVDPPDLPSVGASISYSPLGSSDPSVNVGAIPVSPNSTVVLRDLSVRANAPPGFGAEWGITLDGFTSPQALTCDIAGSFATTCNSGGQTATIPAGAGIRLTVQNVAGATPSNLYYAYRVGGP